MATEYTLYVRHEIYSRLRILSPGQRNRILTFFEAAARDPFRPGDYQTLSPEGRTIQVKVIGAFAILYWADHSACELKIADLLPADV